MYSGQPHGGGGLDSSGTINPAALNSPDPSNSSPRGRKRSRSSGLFDIPPAGDAGPSPPVTKRIKPLNSQPTTGAFIMAPTIPPPQTSQPQDTALPPQPASTYVPPPPVPAGAPPPAPAPAAAPPKTTPTKSTLKALPTVRDHTTDQLNDAGDEYIPREIDEFGEKKVMPNGHLLGNRQYRCRTFLVPNRGDKLFMLATECARVLNYRDSYLLFNKNRSLCKIIATQTEKDDLVQQEILPFSYRSRQIAIVTARSMFRQFGSRVIENGRRVRDDYWEQKARKQGFTENDMAGEKRPGGTKAREAAEAAAAAAAQNNVNLMGGPHTEIVYNNNPGAYPGAPQPPPLVQPGMMGAPHGTSTSRMSGLTVGSDLNDNRPRDYSGIIKGGPRQEINGPAYQDQTRPSAIGELHSQAHHAADFNRSVTQQRDMRGDYLHGIWRRPHDQGSASLPQPQGSSDSSLPTSRPTNSPHAAVSSISQPPVVSSQSPQMMMTAAPYSSGIHAQSSTGQPPLRGMPQSPSQKNAKPTLLPGSSGSMSQGTGYNYQPGQPMWSQNPQTPQQQPQYGSYTTQQPGHPSQSPGPHLRQPSTSQMQPGMQFPGMSGMQYGSGQNMYPADQTPRQYMPQSTPGNPAVSQPWTGQHSPPQQWWAGSPQQPQ